MHFPFSLFASASLAPFTFSSCVGASDGACRNCLNDQSASQVAENFALLFSNYSPQLVESVLTPDFQDQTDSVNWLISNGTDCPKPLGSLSFTSRDDFAATQSTAPNMDFVIENVYHNCDMVFLRWFYAETPQRVQGISILSTVPGNAQQPYLINHVFTEFNTGARLVNEGFYQGTSPCNNQKRDIHLGLKMPYRA